MNKPDVSISQLIDRTREAEKEEPRDHMGCSQLGHNCERWIWLSFRWAVIEQFSGRMRRLFRRGHNEEATIEADLRDIGCKLRGQQTIVDFGAFVRGSTDQIGTIPGVDGDWVFEFKTHNEKSFGVKWDENSAKSKPKSGVFWVGVKEAKPQHYAQIQLYMHGTGIHRGIYYAVCKNDDRNYDEFIEYDQGFAEALIAKGQRLALSERMPEPLIGGSPTWWQCKFCPAHKLCWEEQPTQEANCRTCAHSTPCKESHWTCALYDDSVIPREYQLKGCRGHVPHPDLVPWKMLGSADGRTAEFESVGLIGESGRDYREVICGTRTRETTGDDGDHGDPLDADLRDAKGQRTY